MPTARTVDVPVIRRGCHAHPRRGACLMELASTLPGGRWTDRPDRVPPMLATICRAVNDRLDDAGRAALVIAVPWLAHPITPPPHRQDDKMLREGLLDLAARHAADPGIAERGRRPRPAARALRRAVRRLAARPDGDAAMRRFLFDAIDLVRDQAGLPPVPPVPMVPMGGVRSLPVRVEIRCPDDQLSAYLHCTADLPRWPAELQVAWRAARASVVDRPGDPSVLAGSPG